MSRGTVFVTGTTTGIGRATAERLARAGYDVIPGMRRDEPLPDPVRPPVLIDLGDPDTIGPAAKQVLDRADGNLVGLVNNAGINVNGPVEMVGLEDWRHQFEVNLFGHVALTKELLPALIANRGRIVTVGSIGGRMSAPFLGPYSASKFAVRAWMDAMRLELAPHGVRAVLVEPGAIATPLWEKGTSAGRARLDEAEPALRQRYDEQAAGVLRMAAMSESMAIPPDRCAKVIERALTSSHPSGRYLVGTDAHVQAAIAVLPTRLLDFVTRLALRQPRAR
jgi:NAD(P)-dependent dehydrogenase (short-subunit alcohol dehydrogenase family)